MSGASVGSPRPTGLMRHAERRIGRLLIGATYVSVGLLVIGFVLMMADGVSSLAGGPQLDLPGLGAKLMALDPAGYLWLGLLAVIATPIGRVIVAGIAYAREAEWLMVGIALGILMLMIVGVVTAFAGTV